jgi:DNA-directed RNA polymerase specialized sigma24 family protein
MSKWDMKGIWSELLGDAPAEPARDQAVRHALSTALTEKQREAVELFFFEGMSQSEIARRLGVSQQVIQKRLYGTQRHGLLIGGALPKLREALASLL